MAQNLHINQDVAIRLGLRPTQVHILNAAYSCTDWAESEIINGKTLYWVARQRIITELPILYLKNNTVYKHLVSLKKNGFILYEKIGVKDYIKILPKSSPLFD